MAEIVGAFCVGHPPNMVNAPEAVPPEQRDRILAGFRDVAERIDQAGATCMLIVTNDHFSNYWLDNLPAFLIGLADRYHGPAEDNLKLDPVVVPGHADLARHLVDGLYARGFEPSTSQELRLDHGALLPITHTRPAVDLPVVPILQNCVERPMASLRRCYELGKALREAVLEYPGLERVVILGGGGLSHWVGTPEMGTVNEAWDRRILELLEAGRAREIAGYSDAQIVEGGNGGEEIRSWLTVAAAVDDSPTTTLVYEPTPGWVVGFGIVAFQIDGVAGPYKASAPAQ